MQQRSITFKLRTWTVAAIAAGGAALYGGVGNAEIIGVTGPTGIEDQGITNTSNSSGAPGGVCNTASQLGFDEALGDARYVFQEFLMALDKISIQEKETKPRLVTGILRKKAKEHIRNKTQAREDVEDHDGGFVELDEENAADFTDKRLFKREKLPKLSGEYKKKNRHEHQCICSCGETYHEPYDQNQLRLHCHLLPFEHHQY